MKKISSILFFLLFMSLFSLAQVEKGDLAPEFSCEDDQGNIWNSSDFFGKKVVVVYFYPAAMTGGCTKQACSFRDDKSKLDELDALVIGISGDEVENLKYFKEAHNLNFPLLSDPKGEIAQKFGVPIKEGGSIVRNIGGSDITLDRGVTSSRWTFVIDKNKRIVYKNTEVDAALDSKNTIDVIESL
jgi:peroxiredoxin Q/BCP